MVKKKMQYRQTILHIIISFPKEMLIFFCVLSELIKYKMSDIIEIILCIIINQIFGHQIQYDVFILLYNIYSIISDVE